MRKEIEFGGVESQGIIFTPEGEGEFPAIVCYHGYGSQLVNYAPIAERLASVGIIGMVFSSKFYGENALTGFNSRVDQWILEGQEALEFLTNYPQVEKRKIGVLGTSLGGFVAASLLSENQHIISCVLRAPASYDEQALRVGYSSRSLRAIQDFEGSLL
ncbi:alpha/beta hydrolase, partial [Candidatus Microgenomates bacterium]|nr:alpha/beta hydrolase [Candidatus Microgenomates bacterium]